MQGRVAVIAAADEATAEAEESQRGLTYRRILKPACDRVAGIVLLLLMAPLFIVLMGMIRVKLGRGVLYRQRRVGKDNYEFTLYKFRTTPTSPRTTRGTRDSVASPQVEP